MRWFPPGTMKYWCTGEMTSAVESYSPKGAAIGVLNSVEFGARMEKISLKVESGDRLLLFTDGISEARADKGGRFGMEKAVQSLQKNGGKTCRDHGGRIAW